MKNQWTTVSDSAHQKPRKDQNGMPSGKNKSIAFAMASFGVFLILVGAAPFLFSGKESSQYSAFLNVNSELPEEEEYLLSEEIDFEDGVEIVSEPLPIEVDISEEGVDSSADEPTEVPVNFDELIERAQNEEGDILVPIPEVDFEEVIILPEEVAIETPDTDESIVRGDPVDLTEEEFSNPEVILDDGSDTIPESERSVITETDDFPINTYTGETIDPIALARTATAEQLHGVAEENPETGLPLFPILAFSAGVALLARRKALLKK
jgi:hypothetical protein